MEKCEILAPCGSTESLYAAVKSGADAVYIGAKDFSARASAENFSLEEIKDAVTYCHIRNVKVYLAANTLVFDRELEKALDLVIKAYKLGIDAVIVQDLGLASLIKKSCPDLPLHASTQLSIHTIQGVKLLEELGFTRVVLARELSEKEIIEIAENTSAELEVFVHGALCMSVSGQCYFSALLGSRSGNRGKCAQPCRLPFKVKGGNGYALSLKDSSLVQYIKRLSQLNIKSAKIEGRMKRPEYVAAAVKACREALDQGTINEETKENLRTVFSRTGFTDGYFKGKRDKNLFGFRQKEDVTALTSKHLSNIKNSYKNELKKIGFDAVLTLKAGSLAKLDVSDGTHSVTVYSDQEVMRAENRATNYELAYKSLLKTGDTPYFLKSLSFVSDDISAAPVSLLNKLRRDALLKLSEERGKVLKKRILPADFGFLMAGTRFPKSYRARFTDTEVPDCFLDAELIFLPLFAPVSEYTRLMKKGFNVAAEIPRGMFSIENNIIMQLTLLKAAGVNDVLVSNLGAVRIGKNLGFKLHGGFGLNVTNTAALCLFENLGLESIELSFELDKGKIAALGANIKRGVIAGGYLPLMLVRACPNLNSSVSCNSCQRNSKMQDRLGENFILTCDGNCTEVLNCLSLSMYDEMDVFCGADFSTIRFTVENYVEKVENKACFSSKTHNFSKITRGLYNRGVK